MPPICSELNISEKWLENNLLCNMQFILKIFYY